MATLSELDKVTQGNLENGLWVNEGIHLGFIHAWAKEVFLDQYVAYSMDIGNDIKNDYLGRYASSSQAVVYRAG